jgi:large subunit ribosomal protein L11
MKIANKTVKQILKFTIASQGAKVEPPLGPVLSQCGLKAVDVCKQFNDSTKSLKKNVLLRTEVIVFDDNTYLIIIKNPPIYSMVTESFIFEDRFNIANLIKLYKICMILKLTSCLSLKSLFRIVKGTLKSTNYKVI